MGHRKNYFDKDGNYINVENLSLAEIYERGKQEGEAVKEFTQRPTIIYSTTPVKLVRDGVTYDVYYDRRRRLLFTTSVPEEFARELGWSWKDCEEHPQTIPIGGV